MYMEGTGCRVANASIQFSGQCVGFRLGHVTLVKSIQVKLRISLVLWERGLLFPGGIESRCENESKAKRNNVSRQKRDS